MFKAKAIELLGGSTAAAAKAVGVSYQAVDKWPEELPPRIADRVLAALAREKWPELADDAEPAKAPAADDKPADTGERRRSTDKPQAAA